MHCSHPMLLSLRIWPPIPHGRLGVGLTRVACSTIAAAPSRRSIDVTTSASALALPAGGKLWQHSARSNSSSSRWKTRQAGDSFAREAKVKGLKSRAAFKLIEMDSQFRVFKKGQLVVDLGYAPGSWSQVAMERTKPSGRVLGIDLIPAQPPKGVSTIQGDFLSPSVRELVKEFVVEMHLRQAEFKAAEEARRREAALERAEAGEEAGAARRQEDEDCEGENQQQEEHEKDEEEVDADSAAAEKAPANGDERTIVTETPSYIDEERHAAHDQEVAEDHGAGHKDEKLVDVVLSDMSEPWPQTVGFSRNSLYNPYRRLMNTTGNRFRDHSGSMDLCNAALLFANDTLRPGGHFICKHYQGEFDKHFEKILGKLFATVKRVKPQSSRDESKEAYFVGLRRKKGVDIRKLL